MNKEERKARRKEKKEQRKIQRAEKQEQFKLLVKAAEQVDIQVDLDGSPKFVDVFNQVWPVLQPALNYLKLLSITGPKVDQALQFVIDLGVRISTGSASEEEQTEFIKKLDLVWGPLKIGLGIAKSFTNDKVDDILDKIIEIGDWITDNEDNLN
ncbi:hypothetical protein [Gaoshiqia sp. Z1-71]|uniref:hypothetical protein n=1 Tax=Gaoshiqia hydrogeniformans TaxID=3290090 RepID=UPI003BF864FD